MRLFIQFWFFPCCCVDYAVIATDVFNRVKRFSLACLNYCNGDKNLYFYYYQSINEVIDLPKKKSDYRLIFAFAFVVIVAKLIRHWC